MIRLPATSRSKATPCSTPTPAACSPGDQPRQRPRPGAGARRGHDGATYGSTRRPSADHGRNGLIFDLPYAAARTRATPTNEWPPRRRDQIPAWEMIRFPSTSCAAALAAAPPLLHHRARGRIIQSPLGRLHHPRDRGDARQGAASPAWSPTWGPPRPTCTAWAAAPRDRGRLPQASCVYPASART